MRSRRGRLVWALAGVLALTGCTQPEADGAEPPTVTQSPHETVEPTSDAPSDDSSNAGNEDPPEQPEVEAPERPAAMDEETVDGAIAAAKYFMELYPYIYATGDLEEWDALSDEGCGFCANAKEAAGELHAGGGFAVGGEVQIADAEGGGPYEQGAYIVQYNIHFDSSTHYYGDGSSHDYEEAERPAFTLTMMWRGETWMVLGVATDPAELENA